MSSSESDVYEELEVSQTINGSSSMPLDFFSFDVTPISGHYVLTHFGVPKPLLSKYGAALTSAGRAMEADIDSTWQITIEDWEGQVLSTFSVAELRARSELHKELAVTLECAGNGRGLMKNRRKSIAWRHGGVSTAVWKGALLWKLLVEAKLRQRLESRRWQQTERAEEQKKVREGEQEEEQEEEMELRFFGADEGVEPPALSGAGHGEKVTPYSFGVPLSRVEAAEQSVILAFDMNAERLPLRHGAPIRVVIPGAFGMASVKHLRRIVVQPLARQSRYWQNIAYHYFLEKPLPATLPALLARSEPVLEQRVKSSFAPVGYAVDLQAETRYVPVDALPASVPLSGRAWSGAVPVTAVAWRCRPDQPWLPVSSLSPFSVYSADAQPCGRFAWCQWSADWLIEEVGTYSLQVQATNAVGQQQPLEPQWNVGCFGNNAVQTLKVIVYLRTKA